MPKTAIRWDETYDDAHYVSEVLHDPLIIGPDDRQVPFVLVVECLDWVDTVGERELRPSETRYYKKHGAVWISCVHIIPELPAVKIDRLDVPDEAREFPLYAVDAAHYGYGCPVMPVPSSSGDSIWTSKSCPDAASAAKIAIRYAETKVLPNLDDVLAQPVNQMGELAENALHDSIDPTR